MTHQFQIVQPQVIRKPSRFRGPMDSEAFNRFQDATVLDITNLSSAVNANAQNVRFALQQMISENMYLKRRIESLEQMKDYREHTLGKSGLKIDKYFDFHDTSVFQFPTTLSAEKAAPFKGQFGEAYLPQKAIENKFYNFSLRTTEIVVPNDLVISVDNIFDKLNGAGTQDYEHGGKIVAGTPIHAFNGINETAWVRQIEFPLESNVDQVEVQLTAVVPAGISSQANLIELVPYPEGSVDVMSVQTAPDLSSAFVELDNFSAANNATSKRYNFAPRSVEQIRIRLRSRNWREINGKKVFIYGLQEFGLKLVDYTKDWKETDNFGENATVIAKLDAPSNHAFNSLFRVDPAPNFLLEDTGKRHVRLRLSSTADVSGVFWDSDLNAPPQLGISAGVSMGGYSTVYAIFTMRFVDSSGGSGSPYQVGTTPYINGLGLVFSALPTNANA